MSRRSISFEQNLRVRRVQYPQCGRTWYNYDKPSVRVELMKKVFQSKRAVTSSKRASLQSKCRWNSRQHNISQRPCQRVYWDTNRYHLSTTALPFISRSVPSQKQRRSVSVALWFNEVGGWIIVLVIGAYIIDDVFHFRGYFLAAVWFLICLPILLGAIKWIMSRRNQIR